MKPRLHIRKGDMVFVRTGYGRKGRVGKVLRVFPETNTALVEGVKLMQKHVKPSAKHPDGGIIEKESPIHVSNLMLLDPADKRPTRIGRRRDENGKLVRFARRSGKEIK